MPNEAIVSIVETAHDATGAALIDSYLLTLQSTKSKATMIDSFKRIARVMNVKDYKSIPWHTLGFDELQRIREQLATFYPPSTANVTLSALRQVLKVGNAKGMVTAQQVALLQHVKSVKGESITKGRALLPEEVAALQGAAKSLPAPKDSLLGAVLAVMLGCGLRREETCNLRLVDYVEGNKLYVLGKGKKQRKAPLDAPTQALLDAWLRVRETLGIAHEFLFCSSSAPTKTLTPWALWDMLCALGERAEIKDFGPHDLRRTFASELLNAGLELSDVQKLMGHKMISTTQLYDKRSEEALEKRRRAVRVFE